MSCKKKKQHVLERFGTILQLNPISPFRNTFFTNKKKKKHTKKRVSKKPKLTFFYHTFSLKFFFNLSELSKNHPKSSNFKTHLNNPKLNSNTPVIPPQTIPVIPLFTHFFLTQKSVREIFWKRVEKLLEIKFDSKPIYGDDEKYIKTKNKNIW